MAGDPGGFFSAVVEHSPDCIKILDSDGKIVWISSRGLELLEAEGSGQVEGLEWVKLWPHPDDRKAARQALDAAAAGGVGRFEASCPTFGGVRKWWDVAVVSLPVERGEGVRMLSIWRDITERRAAEGAVRQNEELFRTLADSIPQLAWMARPDGKIFWFNQRWYDYIGQARGTPGAEDWWHHHGVREGEGVRHAYDRALASGEPFQEAFTLLRHDGEPFWHLCQMLPIRDDEGQLGLWFGTHTDITEEREAHRRENKFLATLAHELRNPLAPILTGLEVIRSSLSDPEAIARVSAMMERQTGQMVRLIDDLLDMARINAGEIVLQKSRVSLDEILRAAVEASRPLLNERGHDFEMHSGELAIEVEVDPRRIAQVISNLLSNAAKNTPAGGRIRLAYGADEGRCPWISVSDNGHGIAAAECEKIFNLFEQVDHGRQDGLGIGLTLVKTLVELHGGSIEVKSEGLGRGSEFIIHLPACPPGPDSGESPKSAKVPQGGSWQRVMVVEDSKNTADILAMFFEMEGRDVEVAYDGEEAVRKAAESLPELILMDLGMPRMDGFEAARRIRALPGAESVALVALSGWGQPQDKEKSRAAGFNEHLVKPVSLSDLRLLLQRLDAGREKGPDPRETDRG